MWRYYRRLLIFLACIGVPERKAYCRIDRNGDIEEAIRVFQFSEMQDGLHGTAVSFKQDILEGYMNLTDSVLIRTFDISRFKESHFNGWGDGMEEKHEVSGTIFYSSVVMLGYASYMRGIQIVRATESIEDLVRRLEGKEENPQYASFIAQDWKNGEIKEISCSPGATANYFMKSDLPFELSPAFFRAEVLLKYKADPDEFMIHDRYISCRGAWHLETYDINEEGQVHTYLVSLLSKIDSNPLISNKL